MIVSSLFSWSFLGAGLLLCATLINRYESFPDLTIREVFGGSLLAAIKFVTIMTLVARRRAFTKMLARMTGTIGLPTMATGFGNLSRRMGVQEVSLREALTGSAFSISLNGRAIVAVSSDLAQSLSVDETEAVLAHELSHIKNGDSVAKGIARLARLAFPFDPVLRLAEAALHRERELWADRVAVTFTGRPLALASALVKANSQPTTSSMSTTVGLFVGGNGKGLFSFYPDLERRVDVLVEMARRMEVALALA